MTYGVFKSPAPAIPDTAELVARHMDLVVRGVGGRLYIDGGETVAVVDLEAGAAALYSLSWPRGPSAGRPYLIYVYTLLTLFRRQGLIALHGAALARDHVGVLLVAPSGCGKSTLSLVLLRSGWTYISDDSVLLRAEGVDGASAHGLRRDLFLRSPARDFPELADCWRSSPEIDRHKQRLVVEGVYPGRVGRSCLPGLILLPELSGRERSALLPCPPHEALYRLLDHSTFADLETGMARLHMEILGRLVRQTRSYVLEAGSDLLNDPHRLDGMLRELMAGGGGS